MTEQQKRIYLFALYLDASKVADGLRHLDVNLDFIQERLDYLDSLWEIEDPTEYGIDLLSTSTVC